MTRRGTIDLFEPGTQPARARRNDPKTSHIAAAAIVEPAKVHYTRIASALRSGSHTVSELALLTGLAEQQVNKRLPEMEAVGNVSIVCDAHGAPITRRGASGRPQRVWKAGGGA